MNLQRNNEQFERVAIVGVSGRFPGAPGVAEFWQSLCQGTEAVKSFTDEQLLSAGVEPALLGDPSYVKAGVLLDGVELFDARFFGFTPREAELTDPQHRVFLECAWEAVEDAGYDADRSGCRIGVFAGAGLNQYFQSIIVGSLDIYRALNDLQKMIVMDKDYLATRVSYKLDLRGPSITIQTACSSSLVAVHLACQSLLNGECDMALAGGVSIRVPQTAGYRHVEGSILSPDGHCRAFDADAQGMVPGSGAGIVVLKRLSDALSDGDSIRAVIRGSCVNNDGADKIGYTSPSVSGQARVIAEAQALAGVSADEVTYIETHGTGTSLGDPIEIAGLTQAFRETTQKKGYCAIGSVKTNIGHLDAAAGVAGLIKVVLALQNRMLPPSLNFKKPNPAIDFAGSPFYVQQALSEWPGVGGRRIAGVSSFGIGGTNAHVIVEEAPALTESGESRPWQLVTLSAGTAEGLEKAADNLRDYLQKNPSANLADVSFTLQNGRKVFPHRRFLVAENVEEGLQLLRSRNSTHVHTSCQAHSERQVTFMFPGQAAQCANMGLEIYRLEPSFRETIDHCCQFLRPHLGFDLLEELYPSDEKVSDIDERLEQTAITQPALFVFEYALAQLWMKWGLQPEAMIGHSVGEYVASCLAGVLTLEDALSLVAARGRLMQSMPKGSMIAVRLGEDEVQDYLGKELSLAVVNGPSSCVVAGPVDSVLALQKRLGEKQVGLKLLSTSHAFHSWMMEPMISSFREIMENVELRPPRIPYISNLTGSWIEPAQAVDPGYWTSHLRNAVRFSDGIGELLKSPDRILLEVGPGQTLTSLTKQHPSKRPGHVVLHSLRGTSEKTPDLSALLSALGQLWLAGARIDWASLHAGRKRRRIPLPTYPFDRKRHWVDVAKPVAGVPLNVALARTQCNESAAFSDVPGIENAETAGSFAEREGLRTAYTPPLDDVENAIAGIWQELFGIKRIGREDDFFELGGHSLLAAELFARVGTVFSRRMPLATIFQAPTVGQLASILRQKEWKPNWASLVTIQPDGLKPPFFLVHGAEGNVLLYRQLAHYLGSDQPVYGLQSQGLDGSRDFSATVVEMASHYVSEIRSLQPSGPYYLGGYCMGGAVSLEIAQQLQAQGQKVALLALLETYNIQTNPKALSFIYQSYHRIQAVKFHLDNLLLLKAAGRSAFFIEKAQVQKTRIMMKLGSWVGKPHSRSVEDTSSKYPHLAVAKANDRAVLEYVPRAYSGHITLFRPCRFFAGLKDPQFGWTEIAVGGMSTHILPVYPRGMLVEPFVRQLADELKASLHDAQEQSHTQAASCVPEALA